MAQGESCEINSALLREKQKLSTQIRKKYKKRGSVATVIGTPIIDEPFEAKSN